MSDKYKHCYDCDKEYLVEETLENGSIKNYYECPFCKAEKINQKKCYNCKFYPHCSFMRIVNDFQAHHCQYVYDTDIGLICKEFVSVKK